MPNERYWNWKARRPNCSEEKGRLAVDAMLAGVDGLNAVNGMEDELQCYRCGATLSALTLPLRRLEECPQCEVQLHICRMCVNFAPGRPKQCVEDDAEEVSNKTAANFCDYFQPSPGRHDASLQSAEAKASAQLESLFGTPGPTEVSPGTETQADEVLRSAESLFKSE